MTVGIVCRRTIHQVESAEEVASNMRYALRCSPRPDLVLSSDSVSAGRAAPLVLTSQSAADAAARGPPRWVVTCLTGPAEPGRPR